LGWVAVVEVHDPRRECPTAVGTRSPPDIAKECHRGLLTPPNSLELFVPMFGVVRHVVEALILFGPHTQELEHVFIPCQ